MASHAMGPMSESVHTTLSKTLCRSVEKQMTKTGLPDFPPQRIKHKNKKQNKLTLLGSGGCIVSETENLLLKPPLNMGGKTTNQSSPRKSGEKEEGANTIAEFVM